MRLAYRVNGLKSMKGPKLLYGVYYEYKITRLFGGIILLVALLVLFTLVVFFFDVNVPYVFFVFAATHNVFNGFNGSKH